MTTDLQPNSAIACPANLATALKLDAKKARLLAGKAIRNPFALTAREVLAMAFEVLRKIDEHESVNTARR